jgi:DNA adenine methylase
MSKFPAHIRGNYIEPFVGGGSVLLALLTEIKNAKIKVDGHIIATDINATLIAMYNTIKQSPTQFYNEIEPYIQSYTTKSTLTDKEAYYYECRHEFNSIADKTALRATALFLFLNKTCFRGLWREGPNGFNVPFGNYKTPEITSQSILSVMSTLIQPVTFICQDYKLTLQTVSSHDFVYLDPPYVPEKKTSFTKYAKGDFTADEHTRLFTLLTSNYPAPFLMSNSATQPVLDAFCDTSRFTIETLNCKRSINSKKPESTTNEVLINSTLQTATPV